MSKPDLRFLSVSSTAGDDRRAYVPDPTPDDVVARLNLTTPSGRIREVHLTLEQLAKLLKDGASILPWAVTRGE